MKFLGFVSFLVLVGCGATRFGQNIVNTPSMRLFEQCSHDRNKDEDCIRRLDSQVDLPGMIGGAVSGSGQGYDSYPSAGTPTYLSGPVMSDGARSMETYPSGPVILETGVASLNGSGPASGPAAATSSAAGGYVTRAQGAAIVRKDQQQDRRLDALEQTVTPNK